MSHFFNGFGVWQEPNKSEDNNDENKRRKINKMESNNGKNINNGQITEIKNCKIRTVVKKITIP